MGTDVENPLSLSTHSHLQQPPLSLLKSLSKPHPPPPIHRQLSVSLSRPIHRQLSVSLSLKSVSLKSLHRLPKVGASTVAASCHRVCSEVVPSRRRRLRPRRRSSSPPLEAIAISPRLSPPLHVRPAAIARRRLFVASV
ncbi:hypothetical protein Scep_004446 [Stephania cephalantha]|uniref:Uncharacterized protein n=1 Tax=Stephania cephalantha TaxID=152367 RepID=A0AAP0KSH0_9MAGN